MSPAGGYRVAADVGGTFIDFALLDEGTGELTFEKQLATPSRLAEEFMSGMARLPAEPSAIDRLSHGTTVAINVLLEERGGTVGLVTTQGFRDVLALGRGGRPEIYNWLYLPPEPLVPRFLRREVPERSSPDGSELVPLDLETLDREVDGLVSQGLAAIAVCFLHSYANPSHERAAASRIKERHPDLPVSVSSELVGEWREFERTSTTVLNAYVQPAFAAYLTELGSRLAEEGYGRPLAIMQSNGGVMSVSRAVEQPIRTIASGPAGGVIGAHALARELGLENVICTDVGGTSFDVALIEHSEILERTETSIRGRSVLAPTIDVVSIGAGGGSIAWVDERGTIKVGPHSAGAHPGPACFGLGGEEPTVTDAHVALGRIDPLNFLGARMKLDVDAAKKVIRGRLGDPTGLPLERAADGMLAIAETNMTFAIRTLTIERGLDPREFVLLCYGGGGGLFAAAIAEELSIGTVLIPRAPASFSALGILRTDYRHDVSLTRVRPVEPEDAGDLAADLQDLGARTEPELLGYGFEPSEIELLYRVEVRYAGQEHTVTVRVEPTWLDDPADLAVGIRERFVESHRRLYGHGSSDASLEVVTARCRGIGRVAPPPWPPWRVEEPVEPMDVRSVYFRQARDWVDTPIFDREALALEQRVVGPAIVEEWTSTIIVPPGWTAVVDALGDLLLSPEEAP
ncbi:MAG: hydantoinase/oxoprolinase family protein [Actinobacteria bacterium]|nr:hydantoinase/oxoprolinase family protein [Actinomycetota bacterium]